MENTKPRKLDVAICSLGCIGLITSDEQQEITYSDGNKGYAYVGIHLTDKVSPIGTKWSSRNPKIIATLKPMMDGLSST